MIKTRVRKFQFKKLQTLGSEAGHENARFMKPAQYKRLVENLRRDGVMTSTPLVGRIEGEEPIYIASGNHRVSAALEAGIEEGHCIEILEPLPRERFVAIQLAHNAIEGEDDPTVLRRLYDSLSLEFKEYSGLTDESFSMDDFNVTTLGGVTPMYTDVVFSFLADDAQAVEEFAKSAEKWAKKERPQLVCDYADFDAFFDTVVRTKDIKGVTNTAIALRTMIDIVNAHLDAEQLEAEADSAEDGTNG